LNYNRAYVSFVLRIVILRSEDSVTPKVEGRWNLLRRLV